MFPRRRSSPRGSFGYRGRRFRPTGTTRNADRITRVQRGNFCFSSQITTPTGLPVQQSVNSAFEICKIMDHIIDTSAGQGRAFGGAVKSIDISRIVFDFGWAPERDTYDGLDDIVSLSPRFMHTMLCTDRLDKDQLPCAAVTVQPFLSGAPVVAVSAANPEVITEELQWPTRVLWRDCQLLNPGVRSITNFGEQIYGFADSQTYGTRNGRVNKRIKCRLDDEHGLYLVASTANVSTSDELDFPWRFWAQGAVYYRVNF